MTEQQLPKFLKAKDVADWLGISEQALANDRYRGEGVPFVRIGSRIRYRLSDLLAYVEANTTEVVPAPQPPANRPGRTAKMKRV